MGHFGGGLGDRAQPIMGTTTLEPPLPPGASRVVEVWLRGDRRPPTLAVRAVDRRGEHITELSAPWPTALHAAYAVARRYGLVQTRPLHWRAAAGRIGR